MALGYLRKAYNQNVEDWPTTGFYLTLLIREGETSEAGTVRNAIINTYPDNTSALWIISMADYQLGNRQSAISQLVKLHKSLPESINVINALAMLYQQESKYELAAGMWLKAVEVNPGNTEFVKSLVTNKLNNMTPGELTDWLLKETKRNPEVGLPLSAAAVELLVSQKRLTEAKAVAKPYLKLEQPQARTINANIKRGEALQAAEAQDWKLALKNAQEALEVIPNNVSLIMLVAQVQLQQEDVAGAISTIDEAQQNQPNNTRLINERTRILASYESPKAAYDYMTPLWERSPNGAIAQVYLGLVNTVAPEKLESTLNALLEQEPNNPGALSTLAGISMSNGDNAKAITLYEKAVEANENLVPALNNLAWLLKEQDINKALSYAKRGADLAPNSAAVLDTYGWLLHLSGNNTDAIKVLDQALTIEPDNAEIQAHRDSL
jgi:tetratricopeptide (TPR) repeat protein